MTSVADLRAALAALEAVQRRLGGLVTRTDAERARDLIQGRRDLTAQLHTVMVAGDDLLAAVGDDALQRDFRQRFSAMRSAAAALQASWPAVKVRDEGGEGYVAAVAAVRASDQACIAWTRAMLDDIEARQRASR